MRLAPWGLVPAAVIFIVSGEHVLFLPLFFLLPLGVRQADQSTQRRRVSRHGPARSGCWAMRTGPRAKRATWHAGFRVRVPRTGAIPDSASSGDSREASIVR